MFRHWLYRLRLWIKAAPALRPSAATSRRTQSPYEQYVLLGGDVFFHAIEDAERVLVLGGYEGLSTARWAKVAEEVVVLEPVPDFFHHLSVRCKSLNNVRALQQAAGASDGVLELFLDKDGTRPASEREPGQVKAEMVDIRHLIDRDGPFSVLEINVEGAEYEILGRLLESNSGHQVRTFLIQFHNFHPEAHALRAKIRSMLSSTHDLVWSFDWIWERWDLREQ